MDTDRLAWDRYLAVVTAESARLADTADGLLDAPVPSCPGWTVDTLVRHVAGVYRHKVLAVRHGVEPDLGDDGIPSADPDPVTDLRLAAAELVTQLAASDPSATGWTWAPDDQTHGFWFRRMAHETVVHRIDAELARCAATGRDCATDVDVDVALDGVDEFLALFVGGSWAESGIVPQHPVDASVRLTAEGRSWTVRVDTAAVLTEPGTEGDVDAEVAGSAGDLLAWVWGRVPADGLSVSGDEQAVAELRARFAELS
ncbi:maleylpyruvate isomerase family mycothiol-dependent enzyme [Solicola sp. PLA-1-18]|uniref:maleylpyruvate isomerase family mycothiol-dependent enzyme n=1 Tax=Solicola sp. PLA-1-18 TaxID=3380532 RepID=UPI003B776A4D